MQDAHKPYVSDTGEERPYPSKGLTLSLQATAGSVRLAVGPHLTKYQ